MTANDQLLNFEPLTGGVPELNFVEGIVLEAVREAKVFSLRNSNAKAMAGHRIHVAVPTIVPRI